MIRRENNEVFGREDRQSCQLQASDGRLNARNVHRGPASGVTKGRPRAAESGRWWDGSAAGFRSVLSTPLADIA